MAEIYSCPTCQVQLRAPSTATTIRCPKCKTLLTIERAEAAAPPLPFGPVAAPPKAPTRPPPGPIRARIVVDKADEEERQAAENITKKQRLRKEIEELEAKDEREERRYASLRVHCEHGRAGMKLIRQAVTLQSYAIVLEVILMLFFVVAFMSAVGVSSSKPGQTTQIGEGLGTAIRLILPLAILLSVVASVATAMAMLRMRKGPKLARHLTVLGLTVTVLHLTLASLQSVQALRKLVLQGVQVDAGLPMWQQMQVLFDAFGLVTELPLLSEHPARFLWNYPASWLGIVAGGLEFTRIVTICLIAQTYAEGGKSAEKAHKALKAAYMAFWLMLLAGVFRVLAAYMFDWARADSSFILFVGLIVHGLITFVITVGLALVFNSLRTTLEDIEPLVDAARFATRGDIADF